MPAPFYPYAKSFRIPYRGCTLDSLLELKFVLSIEGDYRFLREPVMIWYHPSAYLSTDYYREGTRTYTPDFLIRHRETSAAFLVEIKPDGYPTAYLEAHKKVVSHFIARNSYDWEFKIAFGADIRLTAEQQRRYDIIAAQKHTFADYYAFTQLDKSRNAQAYRYRQMVPSFSEEGWDQRSYARWVRRGLKAPGSAC